MTAAPRIFLAMALLGSGTLPSHAQQPEDPIWSSKPIRIDRARQNYERLPARVSVRDTRNWLLVPERIKVLDSATFTFGEGTYRIANIRPLKPKRLCRAVEGGRWACGRMASILLGNLVRGKRLLCDIKQQARTVTLSRCTVGARDIAAEIVGQGMGGAVGDDALLAVQAEAQKAGSKGLWRNPECVSDFDGC